MRQLQEANHPTNVQCNGSRPACSRCLGRNIDCAYSAGDDNRGTAPKSYVRLLQTRIDVLEQVLQLHSINTEDSVARLMAIGAAPKTDTLACSGASAFVVNQLHSDSGGAPRLDRSLNLDCDGEPQYFGPASGRLEFQSLNRMSLVWP